MQLQRVDHVCGLPYLAVLAALLRVACLACLDKQQFQLVG